MKLILGIINTFQIVLIMLWTAVCGTLGMILMLFTWNGPWVHLINGRYLWSPFICAITGIRIESKGIEKIDATSPCIYVANHASNLDILGLARVIPVGLFFIAKKELARVPFMGQYMYLIGHIFVDRKNKEAAIQSMRQAAEKIKLGKNIISFPEGTRSKTGELQVFKRGTFMLAKEGQVDIVPIAIIGSRDILPADSTYIRAGRMKVVIGDRIKSSEFNHLSADQLAGVARERIHQLILAES